MPHPRSTVPGGRLVVRDFHPLRKCVSVREGQAVASGNYFDDRFHEAPVAFLTFFPAEEQRDFPTCQLRYWTMGEIITAIAHAGMNIAHLVEVPHAEVAEIPGTFVVTARTGNY